MANETTATAEPTIESLSAQVSDLSGRLATAEGQAADYVARYRDTVHRSAFGSSAIAAGLPADVVDLIWTKDGYEPEADDVVPATIAGLVDRCKVAYPSLFKSAETTNPPATTTPTATPTPRRPIGSDRGKAPTTPTVFKVTEAQLADPKWKSENRERYLAAIASKTIEFPAFGERPAP